MFKNVVTWKTKLFVGRKIISYLTSCRISLQRAFKTICLLYRVYNIFSNNFSLLYNPKILKLSFLKSLTRLEKYLTRTTIIFYQDGASIHTSEIVQEWCCATDFLNTDEWLFKALYLKLIYFFTSEITCYPN